MLPTRVANLHLKDLYDSTLEFLRSPTFSFRPSPDITTHPELGSSSSQSDLTRSRPLTLEDNNDSSYLREEARQHCPSACDCRTRDSILTPPLMRRELDATKSELARSRLEVSKLEERCRLLEKTLRETRDILRARDVEVERLKKAAMQRPSQDLVNGTHLQASSTLMNGHHRKPSGAESTDGESTSSTASSSLSSEEDRAQLRSLEPFLTKVDRWSGAQVIQAVHDLNSEILQFAASAAELCAFDRLSRSPPKATATTQDTTTRLGPTMVRMLSSRDHTQDPIIVQLALQGTISLCIARAMSTFCLGFQTKSNSILSQLYGQIVLAEPQPTSSRWRALAHRYIHALHPDLEDFATRDLIDTIFRWSLDVFAISGCSNSEILRSRFGPQVGRIARAVYKLTQVTREEIMSTSFEVLAVEHGETFDNRLMHDAFEDYAPSRGTILCTTELGLRCSTRRSVSEQTRAGEGVIARRMLLRPKIVLESVVDVLDPR